MEQCLGTTLKLVGTINKEGEKYEYYQTNYLSRIKNDCFFNDHYIHKHDDTWYKFEPKITVYLLNYKNKWLQKNKLDCKDEDKLINNKTQMNLFGLDPFILTPITDFIVATTSSAAQLRDLCYSCFLILSN